jgi:hypothetical protein
VVNTRAIAKLTNLEFNESFITAPFCPLRREPFGAARLRHPRALAFSRKWPRMHRAGLNEQSSGRKA